MAKEILTFADLDKIVAKAKEENKQGLRKAAMIVKSGARQIAEKQISIEAARKMIKARIETERLYQSEMESAQLARIASEAGLVADGLDELMILIVE